MQNIKILKPVFKHNQIAISPKSPQHKTVFMHSVYSLNPLSYDKYSWSNANSTAHKLDSYSVGVIKADTWLHICGLQAAAYWNTWIWNLLQCNKVLNDKRMKVLKDYYCVCVKMFNNAVRVGSIASEIYKYLFYLLFGLEDFW